MKNYNLIDLIDLIKIIKRARQNYLYEKYAAELSELETLRKDVEESVGRLSKQMAVTTDPDKKVMQKTMLAKVTAAINKSAEITIKAADGLCHDAKSFLLAEAKDVLSDWLDSKHGMDVSDNAIFASLPRYWEEEFYKDMAALNVLPADVITRVSEYVPEIVDYIAKIMERGFAYSGERFSYFFFYYVL